MLSKNMFATLLVVAAALVGSTNATPAAAALEGRQFCPQDVDLPLGASCPFVRPPRCDIAEFSLCPGCCPPCPPQLNLDLGGSCPFVRPPDCDRKIWSHCPACCAGKK